MVDKLLLKGANSVSASCDLFNYGLRAIVGTGESAHFKFRKQIESDRCQSKQHKLPHKGVVTWPGGARHRKFGVQFINN